jgi:hypothetical protein
MPWWSWVIIWSVLVLALLGELAYLGYRLFKKAMRAADAFSTLLDRASELDERNKQFEDVKFTPAVLRKYRVVSGERHELVTLSDARKAERREKRLARGKMLITADLRQRTYPWESSATPSDGRTS